MWIKARTVRLLMPVDPAGVVPLVVLHHLACAHHRRATLPLPQPAD